MKTPMQKLRDHLQAMTEYGGDYDLLYVIGMIDKTYLEEEKQVIIDAYEHPSYDSSGEKYYTETFKND